MDDQITVRLPTPLGRTLPANIPPPGAPAVGRRPHGARGVPSGSTVGRLVNAAERVEHLIGSLSSGVPDLAERHREYVLASLKHAR